jgi:hypothetical protein
MGLEDLPMPVQGLRSDQGLMDTDRIVLLLFSIYAYASTATPPLCSLTWHESFYIARIGLVPCWVLLA